jgi:hypothetical protein
MPKHIRSEKDRSPIRVLNLVPAKAEQSGTGKDTDALADAIRRSWTQKKTSGRQASSFK